VPAQFDGVLIYRRKLYATDLRNVLERAYALRVKADYVLVHMSQRLAWST